MNFHLKRPSNLRAVLSEDLLTTAIDHNACKRILHTVIALLFLDIFCILFDIVRRVVWAFCSATENDVNVAVTAGLDDSGQAILGHTHESMWVGCGVHGIDSHVDAKKEKE